MYSWSAVVLFVRRRGGPPVPPQSGLRSSIASTPQPCRTRFCQTVHEIASCSYSWRRCCWRPCWLLWNPLRLCAGGHGPHAVRIRRAPHVLMVDGDLFRLPGPCAGWRPGRLSATPAGIFICGTFPPISPLPPQAQLGHGPRSALRPTIHTTRSSICRATRAWTFTLRRPVVSTCPACRRPWRTVIVHPDYAPDGQDWQTVFRRDRG